MYSSKFMKIVWGVNGVLLLLLMAFATYQLIKENFPNLFYGSVKKFDRGVIVGKKAELAKELNADLQHLMYSSPRRIAGSQYYLAEIVVIDKELPTSIKEAISQASDISISMIGATVNILFFNEDRSDVHKLFDSYGFISRIDFPLAPNSFKHEPYEDSRQYILYELTIRDTNDDGRINDKDSSAFFISGLDGANLRQLTPFGLRFDDYFFSDDFNEIYFELLKEHEDKDLLGYHLKSREIYFYNVKTGKFGKFEKLDEMLNEVGQRFRL